MASARDEPRGSGSTSSREDVLAPHEAFAVLGNETRLAIVLALEETDDPIAYSELKRQVGVYDSGRFNYHLEKLLGHFVERTEGGYRPRVVGTRAARAVTAGTFATRRSSAPPR